MMDATCPLAQGESDYPRISASEFKSKSESQALFSFTAETLSPRRFVTRTSASSSSKSFAMQCRLSKGYRLWEFGVNPANARTTPLRFQQSGTVAVARVCSPPAVLRAPQRAGGRWVAEYPADDNAVGYNIVGRAIPRATHTIFQLVSLDSLDAQVEVELEAAAEAD